jgi:hypothetical protein
MVYRGEDLDLRTPQTWSLPPDAQAGLDPIVNGARGRLGSYSRTPILVDDVMLSCCNHAFDVAAAHRSMDVRVEHLLHAMTRVDGATGALEQRGVRVAGLRRESATIIASEIPTSLGTGQTRPRRSDDFENLLRVASQIAARRNGPANVDDVLDALLELPPEIPAVALLTRHGGRTTRDRVSAYREALPLPPLSRTGLSTEVDWSRKPYYAGETRAARVDMGRNEIGRADYGIGTQTDSIQNARIDGLENALRALTAELSNERGSMSNLVQDLHRNLMAERDDTSRFRGGLDNRLGALEQSLTQQLSDEISRPWSILSERLQGLEQSLLDLRHTRGPDVAPLQERLIGIERALRETVVEANRGQAGVVDRLKQIERVVEAVAIKSVDMTPLLNRLDIIEEAVLSSDSQKPAEALLDRLDAMERLLESQRSLVQNSTGALNADVKSLASALAAQSGTGDRVQSLVSERLQALAAGFERQRADILNGLTERMSNLASVLDGRIQQATAPAAERLTAVSAAIDNRLQAASQPIAALSERIGRLEAALTTSLQRNAELQNQHASELKEVHEALLKLNTNQHTLAGSIDQWRLDGVGDVSVIANRLEGIEKSTAKPAQMLEQIQAGVDNIGRATVERYHRRNRFWYWLFGTDDWLGASWPSQVAAVESERQTLRGGGSTIQAARTTPAVPSKTGQR